MNHPRKMTSTNPSAKLYNDSSQKCYESCRTDSGFLSGANLVSEDNISSEDLSSPKQVKSYDDKWNKNNATCAQTDSGVDVGLNEQFSELTLQQKLGVKNLIQIAKNKHLNSSGGTKTFLKSETKEKCKDIINQPWELYFQQDGEGDT